MRAGELSASRCSRIRQGARGGKDATDADGRFTRTELLKLIGLGEITDELFYHGSLRKDETVVAGSGRESTMRQGLESAAMFGFIQRRASNRLGQQITKYHLHLKALERTHYLPLALLIT